MSSGAWDGGGNLPGDFTGSVSDLVLSKEELAREMKHQRRTDRIGIGWSGGGSGPPKLSFRVHGRPAPQGSKRYVGNGRMIEASALTLRPWREAVKSAALNALPGVETVGGALVYDPGWPLEGPVLVEVTFTLAKPASAPKRRVTWPNRKPDLDKLLRSTFDACSDAGLWHDDAQVIGVTARKVYPDEGIDAMTHPGAVLHIWSV